MNLDISDYKVTLPLKHYELLVGQTGTESSIFKRMLEEIILHGGSFDGTSDEDNVFSTKILKSKNYRAVLKDSTIIIKHNVDMKDFTEYKL